MTTNTQSSIDTPEFRELLQWLFDTKDVIWAYEKHRECFIAHINTWGAAQREEVRRDLQAQLDDAYKNAAEYSKSVDRMMATKASAVLGGFRPNLANLERYMFECRGMLKHPKGEFVKYGAVEEVIADAPQPQEAASKPNADCGGEPANCPDNEGYGCACDPMNRVATEVRNERPDGN